MADMLKQVIIAENEHYRIVGLYKKGVLDRIRVFEDAHDAFGTHYWRESSVASEDMTRHVSIVGLIMEAVSDVWWRQKNQPVSTFEG